MGVVLVRYTLTMQSVLEQNQTSQNVHTLKLEPTTASIRRMQQYSAGVRERKWGWWLYSMSRLRVHNL